MKHILIAYGFISLVMFALMSVLSYGYGVGYVYIYWREWQLQTTAWGLLAVLASLSLVLHLCWWGLQRYLTREQRKAQNIFDFKKLHPYEQLAVIWLLDAGQEQSKSISQTFSQSILLHGIMDAQLLYRQGQMQQALEQLDHTHTMAFELAELQRIQIYLSEKQADKALTHLEFLQQHQLSPWLADVKQAYIQRLQDLWGQFAHQFPWLYLESNTALPLSGADYSMWLEQLSQHFQTSTTQQQLLLAQRYQREAVDILSMENATAVKWLKLLSALPDQHQVQQQLAKSLLDQQFDQDVFYLWFEQQLLNTEVDYLKLEQEIENWETKYSQLPILTFARWHIYQFTQRKQQATQLLHLYPEHIFMSYIRLKDHLNHREDLIRELNLVFQHQSKFLEMNI